MKKALGRLFNTLVVLKILLLLYLFLPEISFANEPVGTWSSNTSLPYLVASHVSFSSSSGVSIIGGSAVTGQSRFNVLTAAVAADGTLSNWETTSFLPSALIWHSLAKKNNFIYVLGGKEENAGSSLDHVNFVFLGTLNAEGMIDSWIPLTPLPKKLSIGAAVVVGERIYFAGGFNSAETNQNVYMAQINPDGTIGAWNLAGLLPKPLSGLGIVEHNNHLIIVGGLGGGGFSAKTYKSALNPDGTLSPWIETATLPQPVYRGGVIKKDNLLLSVGGYSGISFLDNVFYTNIGEDGLLDAWQESEHHLPQRVAAGAIIESGDFLYLTGGFNGDYLKTVYSAAINQNNSLPIPYFSQNDPPWGPTEYNHTASLGFSNTTMDRWGCAVTSAAMVLNYHGMTNFGSEFDDKPIDPGTLNEWLKNNKGYSTGKGKNGSYSSLIWSTIGTLTKRLQKIGKADYSLTPIPFANHDILTSDLELREVDGKMVGAPPVVKVTKHLVTNSHYVVPKGFTNSTVAINDPEWNYPDLTSFDDNNYSDLHRYIPSHTNLSTLYFVVNPDVELLVTDTLGRKTGKMVQNGEVHIFDEIPNAVYVYEDPISNPNSDGQPEDLGTGVNVFFLPEPLDGNYEVQISSLNEGVYTVNFSTFRQDGEFEVHKTQGYVSANNAEEFEIQYSQNFPSQSKRVVDFESAINDANELWNQRLIVSRGVYKQLVRHLERAQEAWANDDNEQVIEDLDRFEKVLRLHRGEEILEDAYQILLYDVNYLRAHL